MSSVTAFISVLEEFVDDLAKCLSDVPKIQEYKEQLAELKDKDPDKVLEVFAKVIKPLSNAITAKDIAPFFKSKDKYIIDLDPKSWWKTISPKSREAIWNHLNTLYMLVTTITKIPKNMMKGIEELAEKCVGEMGEGEFEMPDMAALMKSMQNMMGNAGGPPRRKK